MKTAALRRGVRIELNRPVDDDLFTPEEYNDALTRAQQHFYELVSDHRPDLIRETKLITTSDGGETYDMTDDHLGEMEVWTPPGPPDGDLLMPQLPESGATGFWEANQTIHLTREREYDPGLYIRWIPATADPVDDDNDPVLPNYFKEALIQRAAYLMAKKPGFVGDPMQYRRAANDEWRGERDNTSDTGIIGKLKRQHAYQGREAVPERDARWYVW